ncbi:MAG: hypothetical protein KC457_24880 [Myxococcales bacterium]|nr:hypothetical protein [Myxococcales bacterium]
MKRGAIGLALALVVSASACKTEGKGEEGKGGAEAGATAAALPADAKAFLARLQPLPTEDGHGVEIRYEVSGAMANGELQIQLAPGGLRRERWEISWAGADAEHPIVSRGTTITTPSKMWSARDGEPGEVAERALAKLADAWLALDEPQRRAALKSVDEWHAILAKQRQESPGERSSVQDIDCLQTRIAAQNLCLWEEAGVFLRYEGSAFTIVATAVDRQANFADDVFALPPQSARAKTLEVEPVDTNLILEALAAGNYEAMAGLLAPKLDLEALQKPN